MLIKTKTHKNRGIFTYRNKDWFIENYINQKKDFNELASLANCGRNTIRRWRKRLNIPLQDPHRNYRHRIFTEEHKNRISQSRKGKFCGENHWNWQDGKTSISEKIRKSIEYIDWRLSILSRDLFMCQCCGKHSNLYAHHILPRRDYPELVFDINNGITLCKKCHETTFGKEYLFIEKFLNIINRNMTKVTV